MHIHFPEDIINIPVSDHCVLFQQFEAEKNEKFDLSWPEHFYCQQHVAHVGLSALFQAATKQSNNVLTAPRFIIEQFSDC